MSQDKNLYNNLIASLFPTIHGNNEVRNGVFFGMDGFSLFRVSFLFLPLPLFIIFLLLTSCQGDAWHHANVVRLCGQDDWRVHFSEG